jgi:hypothetical protein
MGTAAGSDCLSNPGGAGLGRDRVSRRGPSRRVEAMKERRHVAHAEDKSLANCERARRAAVMVPSHGRGR